jgi:hypothetical protein
VLSGHANLVHVSPHLRLCFGIASSALRGQKKKKNTKNRPKSPGIGAQIQPQIDQVAPQTIFFHLRAVDFF